MIFLLFVLIPLAELTILILLTKYTSIWVTLTVVLATALLGANLIKRQGVGVWLSAQKELAAGRFPADQLLDGIILLVGGAFLLTPGLLTDLVGTLAVLPPTRAIIRARLKAEIMKRIASGKIKVYKSGGVAPPATPSGPPVEGERSAWPGEKQTPFDR
jgi:UPF0716 protein FxsA